MDWSDDEEWAPARSYFDDVPDELLEIIMFYTGPDFLNIDNTRCMNVYKNFYSKLIKGNVDPGMCFNLYKLTVTDYEQFEGPINSLMGNEGRWIINNFSMCTSYDMNLIIMAEKVLDLALIEAYAIYYLDEKFNKYLGEPRWMLRFEETSENRRFLVGKINEYFVYFEAECNYSGFDFGGGSLSYNTDWKTFWNFSLTQEAREFLLREQQYEEIH